MDSKFVSTLREWCLNAIYTNCSNIYDGEIWSFPQRRIRINKDAPLLDGEEILVMALVVQFDRLTPEFPDAAMTGTSCCIIWESNNSRSWCEFGYI